MPLLQLEPANREDGYGVIKNEDMFPCFEALEAGFGIASLSTVEDF